jgi:hypothetical protein
MNKKLIGICIFILLIVSSLSFAYYPGETTSIGAIYTENNGEIHANANLTITSPSNVILLEDQVMTEFETGKFNYTYTFPLNVTGAYKMEVVFYNDSDSVNGIAYEDYYVQYNYTEDINTLVNVTQENNNMLTDIWDWFNTKILGNYIYETEVIGKQVLYNQVLFKTSANYEITNCEILINTNTYNMSLDGKYAYYDYYIQNDGLYEWEVTCE